LNELLILDLQMKVGNLVGLVVGCGLGALGLVSVVQTAVMMSTETPGASKDFAESSERGRREYEALVERNRVESVNEEADRLIRESQAMPSMDDTISELESKTAELNAVEARMRELCASGQVTSGCKTLD
jgi:hypothetical protein